MRKILFIVLACSASVAFAQQSENRSVGSFSGVKVSEGIEVYLSKGDKERVKVEVSGTDIDNVITEVSGSYLKVHMRDGRYRKVDARVYVTYVRVDKLYASSAGSIYAENTLKVEDMEISASSAGTIEVEVETKRLEASASSAGDVELKGKTNYLVADASSAGEVDADDLQADNVEAEASSGGSVKVYALKSIRARASSGGGVRYRGNPDKQDNSSSSGGSVKKSY